MRDHVFAALLFFGAIVAGTLVGRSSSDASDAGVLFGSGQADTTCFAYDPVARVLKVCAVATMTPTPTNTPTLTPTPTATPTRTPTPTPTP